MRLIDADEEIIITTNLGGNTHSCHRTTVADYLNNVMDKIHIVDAVPVVHAYWTTKRTWQHDGEIYCSACENDAPTEGDYRQVKTKYCPNCGANMCGE